MLQKDFDRSIVQNPNEEPMFAVNIVLPSLLLMVMLEWSEDLTNQGALGQTLQLDPRGFKGMLGKSSLT